ncbi:DUF7344 domain-containing protein [Natronococcus jeotgali]|uniref:DUF7344 domain-containing protein n=1 Tax=Natronococcus jeotgali DSM 18795 TaxID=1227498 RepID=L9WRC5_9EURY|nr:hypothetical protein [Natronococcus jeotgali]ELY50878.1 hypothetical protein C492_21912 [Natronococcus jeotgali DSM 18795]
MSSDAQVSGDASRGGVAGVSQEWYDALRHPRRLHVLTALEDGACTLAELVDAVAARESADRGATRIELVHNHLPRLADHGILEWDGETASLSLERSPPVAELSALLEDGDPAGERTLEVLVHPVRTRLYAILSEFDRPISIEALAAELVDREIGSFADRSAARLALHHVHLPAMVDVGAVEFDPRTGTVRGPGR